VETRDNALAAMPEKVNYPARKQGNRVKVSAIKTIKPLWRFHLDLPGAKSQKCDCRQCHPPASLGFRSPSRAGSEERSVP
jgi:hypothetical protein